MSTNRYVQPKTGKPGTYLEDGKRQADYVIVLDKAPEEPLLSYLTTLRKLGLELESFQGVKEDKIFLLVHIPQKAKDYLCDIYNFHQEKRINLPEGKAFPLKGITKPIYQIPVSEDEEFTSANRIIIINKVLENAKFGDKVNAYGLSKLIRMKVIKDAYPLHDGPVESEDDSNLTDRQLLLKSWANFGQWYKEVPIDLVQKYFGCEIAFYFAWLEFFSFMLVPAALLGTAVFLISLLVLESSKTVVVEEICHEDDMFLCPTCEFTDNCEYQALSFYCAYAVWNYVFDNGLTIFFAVFMSFWATIFVKYWRRRESILKLRWNIHSEESKRDESLRYADRAKRRRQNKFFGTLEAYVPRCINVLHVTCAVSAFVLLIFIVVVALFVVVLYKITIPKLFHVENENFYTLVSCSFIQVIIIKLLKKPYEILSLWLTLLENPRTQHEFDSSVLHKQFLLSFANNYAILFYIAFVKDHIMTKPHEHTFGTILEKDTCQPFGCIVPLCIQLAFLMILKNFATNFIGLTVIIFKTMIGCCRRKPERRNLNAPNEIPEFEKEYKLIRTHRYLLTSYLCEMIIEYGHLTFFVAAFPLAPLIALVNNILEHRLFAIKLVKRYRRPLPRIVYGIGEWNGILLGVTYLSSMTNAFVVAFTSDFVSREVYSFTYSSLHGFVNASLSKFATKDYDGYAQMSPNVKDCYYRGKRLPPENPNKYTLREDYWSDLTWRLICVFAFEQIIMVSNALLSYIIHSIPRAVHTQLNIDRRVAKEAKFKLFSDEIKKKKGTANMKLEDHYMPELGKKQDGEDGPVVM